MNEINRQTGRSFRRILTALIRASEGENVLYLAHDSAQAEWKLQRAYRLSESYGLVLENNVKTFARLNSVFNPTSLLLSNGGSITFLGKSNKDANSTDGFTALIKDCD